MTKLAPILLLLAALLPAADLFQPAPYTTQQIGGVLGERMKINLEGRLLRVDEKAITEGFHNRPGTHPWIGEHAGKFLHAAVNTWLLTKDERLKTLMDRIARSVIDGQLADGYLGTYTDDQRWTSWDVWSHKYNLIGLLAYYEATGYQPALDASRKMGDLLARTFGPGKRDLIASSTHVGMAASSVLEPIATLYRVTGEKRYLDFALYIVNSWDQPNGPKIVASLLTTGSVFKTANAKAYEMMSCLVGLVELYRATGELKYLHAAQAAWADIAARRLYITGTTSSHEHFQDDFDLPGLISNDVGEGCATVTWLQLSWQLLRVTGEQKYADALEQTVYNQLLAAQDPSNGNICYFTPMIGRKNPGPGINCCVSSEPRGISMIPQLAWGAMHAGVAVLLYVPGQVTVNGVTLRTSTDFPASGKVSLTIEKSTGKRFPLYLRVPPWTSRFTATTTGGKPRAGKPGEYMTIERAWKAGDRVEIDMDMTVRVIDGGKSYPGHLAIVRGPQVLTLDRDQNPSIPSIHQTAFRDAAPRLAADFSIDGLVVKGGVKAPQTLKLIPFMDASVHRIWLPKPDHLRITEVAVTAYAAESASRSGRSTGSITDERADTLRTTDRGKAPEQDWFAVELDRPETISRIVFRHGKTFDDGGWFAEEPRVEFRKPGSKEWISAGVFEYPHDKSQLTDGQPFEVRIAPTEVAAIRVIGKPAGFASCAELSAYR